MTPPPLPPRKPAGLAGWLAALLPLAVLAHPAAPAPVDIGSHLELFTDRYLIDSLCGTEQKLHEPQPAGTALVFDRPWEGNTSAYVTILHAEEGWRMYYRGLSESSSMMKHFAARPGDTVAPDHSDRTCYAESPDGIRWTRPSLGIYEFNHSKDNNIVWQGEASNNFSPFVDGNPAAPSAERYKAVGSIDTSPHTSVLLGFVSPDGKHWRQVREKPILTDGRFDSLNVVFWDAARAQYTAIYRDFVDGVRTIKYASSRNFLDWTPGRWADFGPDAPLEHLYTNGTVPYFRAPELYIAMPRRFLPWKTYFTGPDGIQDPGLSDGLFMSSRDGVHWTRYEEAFIRPGMDERNWVHRANTPVRGMIPNGRNEIFLYVERNYTFPSNQVQRMTLRTDGFVSVHAGVPGGEMITKPFVFKGDHLELNYATAAAGSIRIEVQSANGQPMPGFLLEESPLIFGDKVDAPVAWNHPQGETDNGPWHRLVGTPIRLRFVMRDADLYSIRFR